MSDARRDPRPLVVRKDSFYGYASTHHTCKPYRGDGITSGLQPKQDERKISWRKAVILN